MEKKEEVKPTTETATEPNLVERAEAAAKRMEEANKKAEDLNKVALAEKAKEVLAGTAEAGTPAKPQLTPEEKASRDKIKAYGKATGSKWATDMDKEDEAKV